MLSQGHHKPQEEEETCESQRAETEVLERVQEERIMQIMQIPLINNN